MKRRASIPDEQIALEGLVSLSGHNTTATSQQQHQEHHPSQSSRQRLPWNTMNHDDKPASENKYHHHHIPQVQVTFCPSTASTSSSSAPPSESKMMLRDGRPHRPSFSAKDALKDALAASEFGHAATATPYTSIHLPSTFFSTTSSAPTSPSFSLPPLSATLAACCSPSPSPRSSFSSSSAPTASSAAATTSSSTTSAPASTTPLRRASISGATMIHDNTHPTPAKRIKLEHPSTFSSSSSSSSSASSSPMSSPRGSFSAPAPMATAAAAAAMMDDPPEDAQLIPVTARLAQGGDVCIHIEKPVLDALTASGISPESIVDLIVQNDKESRDQVIRETGFSTNYIMKLQRRVLHSSSQLQLPPPVRHAFGPGVDLHVLFDSSGGPLFMKKELCAILGMKGTTFSYWKKKSNVEDTDTSKDFRLMDICRTLFGGRATYTLYSPAATLTILNEMETSRQKNSFSNLAGLKFLVSAYGQYGQRATRLLADPHHSAMALLLDSAADLAASPASSSAASSPPSPPMSSTPTPTTTTTPASGSSSAMDTTPSSTTSSIYSSANLEGASAAADAVGAARSAAC